MILGRIIAKDVGSEGDFEMNLADGGASRLA